MKAYWKKLADRVDGFTLRERVSVFGALAAVLLFAGYELFITPEYQKSKRLSAEIAQRQGEIRSMQDQINVILRSQQADPDRDSRERLALMKTRLAEIEAKIAVQERKFTAPEQMRKVMEELLAQAKGVRLVDLKTIPYTSIAEARGADVAPPGAAKPAAGPSPKPRPAERLIFRHGIEITVAGSYLDLLAYLGGLERLPTQLYWGALSVTSTQYPLVTMKVTIYTLSLDPTWMNV